MPDEVKALLSDAEYAVLAPHYGLDGAPNFEGKYWHLRVAKPLTAVAHTFVLSVSECESRIAAARNKLLAARDKRVWPGRDEKVLVSWNALMIKGMARAAGAFGEPAWLASAQRAADFIRNTMWREDAAGAAGERRQRLLATCKDGRAHLNAYLDDYAFLIDALIELMQAEFRMEDLAFARALADCLLAQFEDREHGGFFFTSHDHEKLIHRAKPGHDNATPAGNGIAAVTLQRLGHLVGEPRYLAAAERAIRLFYPVLERNPSACVSLATALEEWLVPPRMVILRGPQAGLASWQRALATQYRPDTLVIAVPAHIDALPPALAKPAAAGVNAWVCQGVSCLPAITDCGELVRLLGGAAPAANA